MQLMSPADAASRVTSALKTAADATGAGFDYLMRTAQRESSLNPTAKAPTSSARGLFQFIDQTWLQVLKEDGAQLGLGAAAAEVTRSASGRYEVADPARKAEILALRDDPTASALLAGAFTRRNAETLQSALGRAPTEGELYAAHFLGARGAVDLIQRAEATPNASAAAAFPSQASANRAIFYERGQARSLGEVYARLTAGGSAVAQTKASSTIALQEAAADETPLAFNGGVEDDGRAFHSLFKTGRRTPVSAYVSQAWSSFAASAEDAHPLRRVAAPAGTTVATPVTARAYAAEDTSAAATVSAPAAVQATAR
ncbi:lytic transglycosylase domain-containing protein, partial [Methylopila musalis]